MIAKKILLIEDEKDIAEFMEYNLQREGYEVLKAHTAAYGLELFAQSSDVSVVILDLMLPDRHGFDVCKQIRSAKERSSTPIIMVTAKGEDSDIVVGLELGADDYITKPFSPSVLVARIRSVLRRMESVQESAEPVFELLEIGALKIDKKRYEVRIKDEVLELTSTEFHVLSLLASHPGAVYTRKQIIINVHGTNYPVTDRSIDVQMTGLRKKLGSIGDWIETVRGIGYRFKEF